MISMRLRFENRLTIFHCEELEHVSALTHRQGHKLNVCRQSQRRISIVPRKYRVTDFPASFSYKPVWVSWRSRVFGLAVWQPGGLYVRLFPS